MLLGIVLHGSLPYFSRMVGFESIWPADDDQSTLLFLVFDFIHTWRMPMYISENGLTGCIPAGLRDVPNHDLDNIGLDYCARQSTGDGVARDDSIEVKRHCLTSGGSRRSCAAMLGRPFPGTNWTA